MHTGLAWRFAIACAVAGGIIGLGVSWVGGEEYRYFPIASTFSAYITAYGMWFLVMHHRQTHYRRFALFTGGLSGILSHYVCWYVIYLGANVCYWLSGGCTSSLAEAPADPLFALWGSLILSLWSWILLGWLSLIAGVGIAWWITLHAQITPRE